jgi:hypothetical protein
MHQTLGTLEGTERGRLYPAVLASQRWAAHQIDFQLDVAEWTEPKPEDIVVPIIFGLRCLIWRSVVTTAGAV